MVAASLVCFQQSSCPFQNIQEMSPAVSRVGIMDSGRRQLARPLHVVGTASHLRILQDRSVKHDETRESIEDQYHNRCELYYRADILPVIIV